MTVVREGAEFWIREGKRKEVCECHIFFPTTLLKLTHLLATSRPFPPVELLLAAWCRFGLACVDRRRASHGDGRRGGHGGQPGGGGGAAEPVRVADVRGDLRNHRPPLELAGCSGAQCSNSSPTWTSSKVHAPGCPFFGHPSPPAPCPCPLK